MVSASRIQWISGALGTCEASDLGWAPGASQHTLDVDNGTLGSECFILVRTKYDREGDIAFWEYKNASGTRRITVWND